MSLVRTTWLVIITVDLERDLLKEIDEFKRRVRAESQVQHCYCVAGDCDCQRYERL